MFDLHSIVGSLPRSIEILDVGAMIEGEFRYARLLEAGQAHVTAFEPQANERSRLVALGLGITCRSEVLGDGRDATFHITRYPGCSSLLEPDPQVIDAFSGIGTTHNIGNFAVLSTERTRTHRLDDLQLSRIDFIKLDIQGAELSTLIHGRNLLSGALVVETEAEFVPLYRDQPLFGDIQRFMHTEGFLFHRFMNVAGRCWQPFATTNPNLPISQPLWADAIFVRDPCRLDRWHSEDLLVGAVLLHDLYGSFDVALRLLWEHDRRLGTTLATAYCRSLQAEPSIPVSFCSVAS